MKIGSYLDTGEKEFSFTICTRAKSINGNNNDQTHRYPHCIVDFFVPIIDQNGGGGELSREDLASTFSTGASGGPVFNTNNDPVVVIVPPHGKRKCCLPVC